MGEPDHGLTDGDDLAGLGKRRRDDAVGIGLKIGIVELIAGEIERAASALEPSFGFVVGRLLAIEVGDRGPAARLAAWYSARSRPPPGEIGGRRGELGLGAFDLQLQVLRIEPRHDVADIYAIADIDDAGDDLAGDAEAEIGFVAGAHHAHEFPRAILVLEGDALDPDRTLGLGGADAVLASQAASRGRTAR